MLAVEPAAVACDLHPEYLSTKWAEQQGLPLVAVQHHHAHAAACLAEHGEEGPALALVFDGTGYGTDGTLWGGELLKADLASFERLAWLEPAPLPGGEAAVREPWRIAAMHLERAGLPVPWPEWETVRASLTVNAPLSSGMGRLFDAAAAVLGVRDRVSYEGQAAIELEQLAGFAEAEPWAWRFGATTALVARVADELDAGRARADDRCGVPRDDRRVGRGGGVRARGRLRHRRPLRRLVPEPAPRGVDPRPARGVRLPRARAPARAAERRRRQLRPGGRGGEEARMCLAVPGQIVERLDDGLAKVDFTGVRRNVSVVFTPDAEPGDWVLVHVGFALAQIDEDEARATLELLGEAIAAELAQ